MNDIFDLVCQEFNPTTYKNTDFTYFHTVPSTQEVRDKNASLMESALLNNKFIIRTIHRQCTDGEEFEILEIRGPKASGFFLFFLFFFACAEIRNSIKQSPDSATEVQLPPSNFTAHN